MPKIYQDKENITFGSANAAKTTTALPGRLKSNTQGRKPFCNVGNIIQSRQPCSSKADIKSSQKLLENSSPERLKIEKTEAVPEIVDSKDDVKSPLKSSPVNIEKTEAEPEVNVGPVKGKTSLHDWPEIEYVPPFYEPEDDFEDIWPKRERLSHDDFMSLKFFKPNFSDDSPDFHCLSPVEPLEFMPLDQSMFEMDCFEAPSEVKESLCPLPSLGKTPFNNVGNSIPLLIEREAVSEKFSLPDVDWSHMEMEHIPSHHESEDDFEDILPKEERPSRYLSSLKFLTPYNSVLYDSPVSPVSSIGSPQLATLLAFDQCMDHLAEPSILNDSLHPIPMTP